MNSSNMEIEEVGNATVTQPVERIAQGTSNYEAQSHGRYRLSFSARPYQKHKHDCQGDADKEPRRRFVEKSETDTRVAPQHQIEEARNRYFRMIFHHLDYPPLG